MALNDDIRVLGTVSLFEGLTREHLRLLAFGAENARLPAGREIYRQGARADCAYVVSKGEVDLVRRTVTGNDTLATMGRGALLGEMALIMQTDRRTGAVAKSDVELIRLNRSLFRRVLEEYPEVAARLHGRFAAQLRELADDVGHLERRFSD